MEKRSVDLSFHSDSIHCTVPHLTVRAAFGV